MDHMGSDLSTVNAARVSFANESEELDARDQKLIKYLADHRHMTPFRHNQVQVRCRAPIFLARQLGKHQAGLSWSEVSRRYVDSDPEFYVPEVWRSRPDGSVKQGSGEEHPQSAIVAKMVERTTTQCLLDYNAMIDNGVAPELARMILPQSMLTTWVWTGNLLAFAHVYRERIDNHAQLEAQMFAHQLDAVIRPLFPVTWAALT
jgi:thymidylate synthase (FAD)